MKKWIVMTMAALMLLSLTACGDGDNDGAQQITLAAQSGNNAEETTAAQETEGSNTPVVGDGVFSYIYEGVELIPGEAFDTTKLPAAASSYTVPSCALEGTDNVYNYETFEITAFDDGNGEQIYSIYFIDPNLTTAEGLALGDDVSAVLDLYGDGYEVDGTAYIYYRSNTLLSIIVENDTVVSIEYRLVTE